MLLSAPARDLLFSQHTLISWLLFSKQLFSISLESSSLLPFFIKMAFSARSRYAKGCDESGKVSLLGRSWLHVSLWPLPTSKNQRSWSILWVIARLFSRTGCCWPNNHFLKVHVFPGEGSSRLTLNVLVWYLYVNATLPFLLITLLCTWVAWQKSQPLHLLCIKKDC